MQSQLLFAYRRHVRLRSLASRSKARRASSSRLEKKNAVGLMPRTPSHPRRTRLYSTSPLKNGQIDIQSFTTYSSQNIHNAALSNQGSNILAQYAGDGLDHQVLNRTSDARCGSKLEFTVKKYFSSSLRKSTMMNRDSTKGKITRKVTLPRSPAAVLGLWLDLNSTSDRDSLWSDYEKTFMSNKTPLAKILLRHLHQTQHTVINPHSPTQHYTIRELETLSLSGFSVEDVSLWGTILMAPSDEEIVHRYLASQTAKPLFLLREILRRPKLSGRSFRALLLQLWDIVLRDSAYRRPLSPTDVEHGTKGVVDLPSLRNNALLLEENLFIALTLLCFRHARQVLAPALVSITQMVVFYCERLGRNINPEKCDLEPRLHRRLCSIYNKIISSLALPSTIHPMLSMSYNWRSQRLLLESAGTFQPPLQLNKTSYRAVSQVLTASKKSHKEVKYSGLIQRPWPPWRKEQDGMDVDRSPDDDISRVAATISRMSESGYGENTADRAIKILGGREPDGTPTIQTRRLVKMRNSPRKGEIDATRDVDTRLEWAARIEATRDVREAWEAFQGFTSSDLRPSIPMYHAMFRKLIFNARSGRQNLDALPGDGLEILPILEDNLTESEMLRLQPPSIDTLFTRMLEDGCRPSGRLLDLLISHATSFRQAVSFIKNSTLPPTVTHDLFVLPELTSRLILERVPDRTLAAFVRFLAWPKRGQIILESQIPTTEDSPMQNAQIHIKSNSLKHAYELVKCRQSSSSIVWNEIFKGLARTGAKLDWDIDQHHNDMLTWHFLKACLEDSQRAGAQLDPSGFQFLCAGLQKAQISAPYVSEDVSDLIQEGLSILKNKFSTLTDTAGDAAHGLPRLLYSINGAQLHSYVRVMGLADDVDEVVATLQWMVQHQYELNETAEQSRNGTRLFRRTLIAARAFFDNGGSTESGKVAQLRDMIEQLDGWGGWPTDDEANQYSARRNAVKGEADEES